MNGVGSQSSGYAWGNGNWEGNEGLVGAGMFCFLVWMCITWVWSGM